MRVEPDGYGLSHAQQGKEKKKEDRETGGILFHACHCCRSVMKIQDGRTPGPLRRRRRDRRHASTLPHPRWQAVQSVSFATASQRNNPAHVPVKAVEPSQKKMAAGRCDRQPFS
jgi:hypothetical protein